MHKGKRIPLYSRGDVYWSWYFDTAGERQRFSTKQRTRSLATTAARRIIRERLEDEKRPPSISVEDAVARYLAHAKAKNRATATLDYYVIHCRPLVAAFGAHQLDSLTTEDLDVYLAERQKPRTIKTKGVTQGTAWEADRVVVARLPAIAKELRALGSVLRFAARRGWFHGEVARLLPDLRGVYKPGDRVLTHEEFAKLHEALGPAKGERRSEELRQDYLLAFVGLGVRDSELYRITAIDLAGAQVHIRGRKTGGADRWIPLRPELAAMLARRKKTHRTGPLFPLWHGVRRDLGAACKRAQIDPVTPNDLRRTFATWLAESGVPEPVTVSLMGHSSSAMVRRVYVRIGADARRRAIENLPALGTVTVSVTHAVTADANSGNLGKGERAISRR
jgi:integrase